jgi:exonuclease III
MGFAKTACFQELKTGNENKNKNRDSKGMHYARNGAKGRQGLGTIQFLIYKCKGS